MNEGTNLAKAYVQIVPSMQGAKGALSGMLGDATDGPSKEAGATAGSNIAGMIKKVVAAAGIGMAIKKVVSSALSEGAALQQSIGGIETLFGAGGAKSVEEYAAAVGKSVDEVSGEFEALKASEEKMLAYADNAWQTAGISANDYMETSTSFAASLLASLDGDTNAAAEAANKAVIAMADNANKMGTDMASIQNAYQGFAKGNYTMLDNLKLGYGGTKEEMERLLKDAQKLSGVKYDIDNLADVYNAVSVMQDKLGITGTTAKEAASTFSGSMASMKASAQNVLGKLALGEDVTTSVEALGQSVSTFLMGNLLPMISNIFSAIPQVAKTALSLIGPILSELLASLPDVISMVLSLAPELISTAGTLISMLLASLGTMLPQVVSEIIAILPQVVQALSEAAPLLLTAAVELLTALVDAVPVITEQLIGILPTLIDTISDLLIRSIPILLQGAEQLLGAILIAVPKLIPPLMAAIPQIINALINGFFSYENAMLDAFISLLHAVIDALPTIIQLLTVELPKLINFIIVILIRCLPQLYDAAVTLFTALLSALPEVGAALADALPGLLEDAWNGLVGSVTDLCDQVWDAVEEVFGPAAQWVWDTIVAPVVEFFRGVYESVSGFFTDLWNSVVDVFNTVIGPWIEIAKRLFAKFKTDIVDPILEWFGNLWNGIKEIFAGLSEWFDGIVAPIREVFSSVWTTISEKASEAWEGIKSVFQPIADWFSNIFSSAWQKVKDVFSTGGKVFDGIKEGIVSVFKTVVNAIIRGINKVISVPFNAINSVLSTLRDLTIVGIKPFQWIGTLTVPQIPELAQGGILRAGQVGLLEGTGAEAVVPLDQNERWVSAIARELQAESFGAERTGARIKNDDGAWDDRAEELLEKIVMLLAEFLGEYNSRGDGGAKFDLIAYIDQRLGRMEAMKARGI